MQLAQLYSKASPLLLLAWTKTLVAIEIYFSLHPINELLLRVHPKLVIEATAMGFHRIFRNHQLLRNHRSVPATR